MGPKRAYVEEEDDAMNDENVVPVVIPEQDANISNMPGPSILKKGKAGEVEERSTCERLEKEVRFSQPDSSGRPPSWELSQTEVQFSPCDSGRHHTRERSQTEVWPPSIDSSPPPSSHGDIDPWLAALSSPNPIPQNQNHRAAADQPPESPQTLPKAKKLSRPMEMGRQYVYSSPYWNSFQKYPRWISEDLYRTQRFTFSQKELRAKFNYDPKPVLPRTDLEFERRHEELFTLVKEWVEKYFCLEVGTPRMTSAEVKKWGEQSPLLVRWIDSVASAYGLCWLDVLSEAGHLLAMAVLGKVLEDRVFKDEFFGGSEDDKKLMRMLDRELEMREVAGVQGGNSKWYSDAFTRQKPRAILINAALHGERDLPLNFADEVDCLFDQLVILLRPLIPITEEDEFPDSEYYEKLDWIIALAGKLSLDMRREPDTVYYIAITPPQHKGLDLGRMAPIILNSTTILKPTYEAADDAEFDDYTNIISVWPGVVAYHRLTYQSASFRIIHRAKVFSKKTDSLDYFSETEKDPEKIVRMSQLWRYLRYLGVSNRGDGRSWTAEDSP